MVPIFDECSQLPNTLVLQILTTKKPQEQNLATCLISHVSSFKEAFSCSKFVSLQSMCLYYPLEDKLMKKKCMSGSERKCEFQRLSYAMSPSKELVHMQTGLCMRIFPTRFISAFTSPTRTVCMDQLVPLE